MIDSTMRDELRKIIFEFLQKKINNFEFDDALVRFYDSGDILVSQTAKYLWYFYDDIDQHYARMSEHEQQTILYWAELLKGDTDFKDIIQKESGLKKLFVQLGLIGPEFIKNKEWPYGSK